MLHIGTYMLSIKQELMDSMESIMYTILGNFRKHFGQMVEHN